MIQSAASADDLSKLVAALNGLADLDKKEREAKAATKSEWYELLKTFSVAIVPLLTLATLAVTVYFQWDQARITSRANEDARWRAVSDAFTKPPGPTTDVLVTTSLLPFYDSERYRDQAYEMTHLLASRITDEAAFETLFRGAFVRAAWNNIDSVIRLSRALERNYNTIDEAFEAMGGKSVLEKHRSIPHAPFKAGDGIDIFQASHARDAVLRSEEFLANEVAEMLRGERPNKLPYTDFSGFQFFEADLSSTNFDQLNISGAAFTRATVDGAKLTPAFSGDSAWEGTAWWRAKQISGKLLESLLANAAPDFGGAKSVKLENTAVVVEREDYVAQVRRLCADAKLDCTAQIDHALRQADAAKDGGDPSQHAAIAAPSASAAASAALK